MAITNHERVGKALDLLRDGLRPFVERELKAAGRLPEAPVPAAKPKGHGAKAAKPAEPAIDLDDVHVLLATVWDAWHSVFSRVLGESERTLVKELRDVRNRWAHQRAFSTDDAYRALDSAARLLTAISAPESAEIEKMKTELLRMRFEEQEQVGLHKGRATTTRRKDTQRERAEKPKSGGTKMGSSNRCYDEEDNPAPRCPVVLLLDTSGSMAGKPIAELKEALGQFLRETAEDEATGMSVELCVITYGQDTGVGLEFTTVKRVDPPPELVVGGLTPMGQAIRLGLYEIHERRKHYKRSGISAYKPWMVLMTDGQPNDDWEGPASEARTMAENNQLNFFGVGVGPDVDMQTLRAILPAAQPPVRLRGLRFKPFFRWLTDSLRLVTSGTLSMQDKVRLAPTNRIEQMPD